MVQELAKKLGPKGPASYAQVLRQNATSSTVGGARRATRITAGTDCIKPVPLVHTRQLIVNPGSETEAQKRRTGQELADDINATLGTKDVAAAQRL